MATARRFKLTLTTDDCTSTWSFPTADIRQDFVDTLLANLPQTSQTVYFYTDLEEEVLDGQTDHHS